MMIVEPVRTAPGVGGRGYTAALRSCRILAVMTAGSGGTTGPASENRTGANWARMARSDALSSRARQLTPQARERGIPLRPTRIIRGTNRIRTVALGVAVAVASLTVGAGSAVAGGAGGAGGVGGVGAPQAPRLK